MLDTGPDDGQRGVLPDPRHCDRAIAFAPRTYRAIHAPRPPTLDGRLDDAAWQGAAWTDAVVDIRGIDIRGGSHPAPRFATRAKIVWDDTHDYYELEVNMSALDRVNFGAVYVGLFAGVIVTKRHMKSVADSLSAGRSAGRYLLSVPADTCVGLAHTTVGELLAACEEA